MDLSPSQINLHMINSYRIMTTQKPMFRLSNNNKEILYRLNDSYNSNNSNDHKNWSGLYMWVETQSTHTLYFLNYACVQNNVFHKLLIIHLLLLHWMVTKQNEVLLKNKDLLCNITLSKNISISLFCLTFRNCKTKIIEQWKNSTFKLFIEIPWR